MTKTVAPRVSHQALHGLARLHGVQTSFTAGDGRRRAGSEDALVAVLGALGAEIATPADAPAALARAEAARRCRPLEPVVVHRSGRPCRTTLTLPAGVSLNHVWITTRFEDGREERRRLDEAHPELVGDDRTDGVSMARYRLSVGPATMPFGYHVLDVEAPGISASATVISAPRQCPPPAPTWGASIPLYALRTENDWGTGSYRDLASLGRWLHGRGASVTGTLPLNASFVDPERADPSPYLPSSRLAWNEAFIDVDALPELAGDDEAARRARTELASPSCRDGIAHLRQGARADLQAVSALKRPVLEHLAASLCAGTSSRRDDFRRFVDGRPDARAYALFRAACERLGADWRGWDQHPSAAADPGSVRYHLYAQWVADEQLAAVPGLYVDLPVGVHPSGFDPWREPDAFVTGVSGGAPPDEFFSGGQVWGFPPLHPERIRDQGYRHVVAVLRHAMRHAAMVRLDHVIGLHRLFWVPEGADAGDGLYVRYHAEEMHAIVVLEASRSGTVVVGEDLGTVPPGLRDEMARDGMLSSFVVQFASSPQEPFPTPPEQCLASVATHDLPTFDTFWAGADIAPRSDTDDNGRHDHAPAHDERARWRRAVRREAGLPDAFPPADDEEWSALRAVLAYLAASPAAVVLVDLEDLWLEPEQQNRPGTRPAAGNFTRRAARTLEALSADGRALELLDTVARARMALAPSPTTTTPMTTAPMTTGPTTTGPTTDDRRGARP